MHPLDAHIAKWGCTKESLQKEKASSVGHARTSSFEEPGQFLRIHGRRIETPSGTSRPSAAKAVKSFFCRHGGSAGLAGRSSRGSRRRRPPASAHLPGGLQIRSLWQVFWSSLILHASVSANVHGRPCLRTRIAEATETLRVVLQRNLGAASLCQRLPQLAEGSLALFAPVSQVFLFHLSVLEVPVLRVVSSTNRSGRQPSGRRA